MIENLIRQFRIEEAFQALIPNVANDKESQKHFLRILRSHFNVFRLQDRADEIRIAAESGNPYMQFAWARYHDCVQPSAESDSIKREYYEKAMQAGIADARANLAICYVDGDFGESDEDAYRQEMQKAADEGSETALLQILRERIHGNSGFPHEPEQAFQDACNYIIDNETADGAFYHVMADAQIELGQTDKAIEYYKLAAQHGDNTSFWWLALYCECDEEGTPKDRQAYLKLMKQGQDAGAADCWLDYTLDNEEETAIQREHLEQAYNRGESLGAYYLGHLCQDQAEAWEWFRRGAARRDAFCMVAMAEMILKCDTAPKEFDDEFAYECYYRALQLGYTHCLPDVIEGWHHGYLDRHANAIEQVWEPRYWEQEDWNHDYNDDDYEREIGEDDWSMDPDIF